MQVYIKHLQSSVVELPSMQMFNFNTLDRLDTLLDRLEASDDFQDVRKIFILADVGPKLNAREMAILRAENRLNKFSHVDASYYLFPGLRTTKHWEFGYLEDALLKALQEKSAEAAGYYNLRNMAEEYIFSVNNNRGKENKLVNTSLHFLLVYLAGTEKYAGMRIAEAAANGAFNLEHPVFAPLRERFTQFFTQKL